MSYRYPERDRRALDDVTFAIPAGGRLTIVGPSGAGKSTLAGLLLRFLEPDDGRILVGGVDVADLELGAAGRRRACRNRPASSTGRLPTTCASPARYATTRELLDAVDLSGAGEVIADLPSGLDTNVGEGGPGSAVASGNASRLPVRCSATPASCSSTNRRRTSTRPARRQSWRCSNGWPVRRRSSPSRTGRGSR